MHETRHIRKDKTNVLTICDNNANCTLVFKVSTVKKLVKKYKNKNVFGGDHKKSKFVLVPLKELFVLENIKNG